MVFEDRELTCRECGQKFLFSAAEQNFFENKGFKNDPARCPECRKLKRDQISKALIEITCAECQKKTKVNFEPQNNSSLWCRDCFEKIKSKLNS